MESLLDIETEKGPIELPMLVGALLRSTEVRLVNHRRQYKRGQYIPSDWNGPRFGPPPDK